MRTRPVPPWAAKRRAIREGGRQSGMEDETNGSGDGQRGHRSSLDGIAAAWRLTSAEGQTGFQKKTVAQA